MDVTVCTLTRDRTDHLLAQIEGLSRSDVRPAAHVVAVMGGEDPRPRLPATPWETRVVDVVDSRALPLARARNEAVRAAPTAAVILLDVDCIPSSSLVGSYAYGLSRLDGLLVGGVRYLPPGATEDDWTLRDLHDRGVVHPSRPDPPRSPGQLERTDAYELFWSLSFAVRRLTMLGRIGGFDEDYGGYGGEDTDFAFRARASGVPLAWIGGAWAYHQHHDTYDPPLQHVASIVANARRFREVWGRWPMEGWLRAFHDLGVVRWEPGGKALEILRDPQQDELRAAHRPTAVPRPERRS